MLSLLFSTTRILCLACKRFQTLLRTSHFQGPLKWEISISVHLIFFGLEFSESLKKKELNSAFQSASDQQRCHVMWCDPHMWNTSTRWCIYLVVPVIKKLYSDCKIAILRWQRLVRPLPPKMFFFVKTTGKGLFLDLPTFLLLIHYSSDIEWLRFISKHWPN